MKKKAWEFRILDNPNRVTGGENDQFYSTDTEAFLVFDLVDENFNPIQAMLTLVNTSDKSVVNETVTVIDGEIMWEMREEIIEHAGNWQAQLVYMQVKNGVEEKYTSPVVSFSVSGHLLDQRTPAIVDIENWNSFIAHAGELIDDWEQLEKIRQGNERQRELAESARQTTFETNESTRQSEFEANEQGRESAESERAANEAERISKDSERDSKIEAVESNLESKVNKKQEDWITPTLLSGATGTIKYMKNELGKIEFKGVCTSIHGVPVFRLPIGYRVNVTTIIHLPITATPFPLREIQFLANGEVYFVMPYGSSEVNFNGASILLD